jgi:hypothetical protein
MASGAIPWAEWSTYWPHLLVLFGVLQLALPRLLLLWAGDDKRYAFLTEKTRGVRYLTPSLHAGPPC